MLPANQIISLATEAAHCPGKVAQAQLLLNEVLSNVCHTRDIAQARRSYVFTFAPGVIQAGPLPTTPVSNFGSGPYPLPLDFLRMSGTSGSKGLQRSFVWWLNGVPYPVIPCDLAEFDLQVQQAGLNSYVWLFATDTSAPVDDRILQTTTADVAAGSTGIANIGNLVRLVPGLGVAGQGIVPGTTLVSVNTGAGTAVLSQPAILTIPQASLIFGQAPTCWLYPPPSSNQQAQIRYQALMPPMTDFTRYPWFPYDDYLKEMLIGKLCEVVDDERATHLLGGPDVTGSPDNKLSLYLANKDADSDKPKSVQLDRRTFGGQWPNLKTTKTIGWD